MNFGQRNGGGTAAVLGTDRGLLATAPDGSTASCQVPFLTEWGPPAPGDDPVAAAVGHVLAPRAVGVLLVRLGGFAAGVFEGETFTASKAGSRHVQGRSAAGGWSQQRFARRRAQQAGRAFEAAADSAVAILLPAASRLETLVLGGERRAVDAVLGDRRLTRLAKVPTEPRFLTVPDPRRDVLLATPEAFRAVRIAIADPADG